MTATAQYASTPKNGVTQISTANANRDGTGTVGMVCMAGASGMRIDSLTIQATGTTTAGMVRFFLTKGRPLGAISTITFTGTTAIVTTVLPHGLTTGQLASIIGASPDEYNVVDASLTVTGANSFTYVMGTAPTANATVMGSGATSTSPVTSRLVKEVSVDAITPSATVKAFATGIGTNTGSEKTLFPLSLQAGWSLRASTEKAEAFNIIPTFAGDF